MKILRNKSTITAIAFVLVLTISAILAALPAVTAHDPGWTVPTYGYIGTSQDPIGVGQALGIIMWLDKTPPTAGGLGGDRWRSFTVTIEKPDGTTQTLGPFTSDPIGTYYTFWTPDQAGTHYLQFHFGGQTALLNAEDLFPGAEGENRGVIWVGDYFEPSDSAKLELTVTQEAQPSYPGYPLPGPNDYWDRPLQGDIKGWNTYASNWLGGSQLDQRNFQPYGVAPNSPHVMWVRPLRSGGIVGDIHGDIPYGPDDYESPWSGAIVMNGIIYYNNPAWPKSGYYAIDLRTGEELWFHNESVQIPSTLTTSGFDYNAPLLSETYPGLSFGWNYRYYSLNGQGVWPFLWINSGSTWNMIDPNNGDWVMALTHVPGGTTITSNEDGDIQSYSYSNTGGYLQEWSLTTAIPRTGPVGSNALQWRPRVGAWVDAVNDTTWTVYPLPVDRPGRSGNLWTAEDVLPRSGYEWNVTAPKGLGSIRKVVENELVLFSTSLPAHVTTTDVQPDTVTFSAVSLKPATRGQLLWTKEWTVPSGMISLGFGIASIEDKVFTITNKEKILIYGFSLDNGNQIWTSDKQADWNMFGISENYAYNTIYATGYAGHLYAIDAKTGALKWDYFAANIGGECPYGQYPLSISAIADGKVYLYSTEHSPTKPLWRGSRIRCIDAFTGEELWTTLHWGEGGVAVADGYLVSANRYDDQIYCFGKGPSATTVTGPEAVQPLGTAVMIKGTVTDQSAGTKDPSVMAKSPLAEGVPAIADENMAEYMEYLYQNKPMPTATGVTVTLDAVDPNGNFIHIDTVTSDMSGMFKTMWTPEHEGEYTIIASFAGSGSYFSSYAETAIGVGPAPSPAVPIEPEEPTAAPLITTEVAIIAVVIIAVVGIVAFWALKKRK